jgi:hypothetical protein
VGGAVVVQQNLAGHAEAGLHEPFG